MINKIAYLQPNATNFLSSPIIFFQHLDYHSHFTSPHCTVWWSMVLNCTFGFCAMEYLLRIRTWRNDLGTGRFKSKLLGSRLYVNLCSNFHAFYIVSQKCRSTRCTLIKTCRSLLQFQVTSCPSSSRWVVEKFSQLLFWSLANMTFRRFATWAAKMLAASPPCIRMLDQAKFFGFWD